MFTDTLDDAEQRMDLLRYLGQRGLLINEEDIITDAEIDAWLRLAPSIEHSPLFEERCRATIARAVADRAKQHRHYRVYYARWSPYVGQGSRTMIELYEGGVRWASPAERPYEISVDPPILFTVSRLPTTHIMIRELDAPNLDTVFHQMQADHWLHNEIIAFGEEIDAKGLTHSSLSPGDIVEDIAEGRWFECDLMGWRELDTETNTNDT